MSSFFVILYLSFSFLVLFHPCPEAFLSHSHTTFLNYHYNIVTFMNVFVADMRRTATAMRLCFADGQATINRYLPFGREDRVADFIARHNLVAITDTGNYNHVRNQETWFLL